MIQNDDYIEFDLKALFFYILRQWKPVLILCLAAAVLLGCLMAYSEYNTSLAVDMENSYWAEYQQYQDQIAFFEDRVNTTQDRINTLQDYIAHSVLMKTDHRNVYIAKATYYVDSGYKILPENTYQDIDKTFTLSWLYRNYLSDYSLFEAIGSEVNIDAKYLMELVDVSIPNDQTISITVSHPTKRFANSIMEILQEKLQLVHLNLNETVGDHTITLMLNTCGVYVDEELNETQQAAYDDLLVLQDDLITYREELYTLKEGPAPGELNVVTAFIKWFVLGGALSGILVVLFLFMKSILQNRLHSTSQLISSFHATVLGEMICSRTSLSPVSQKINKQEGCLSKNSEGNLQFLAENIRNHCCSAKNVLICCDANPSLSTAIAEALNKYLSEIRLLPVGDLLTEASALRTLSECDAVVMVAVRDHSRNTILRKMLTLIHSYKKETVGFIVTY